MECVLALSRNVSEVSGEDRDVFELKNIGLYAALLPTERLSFFYDKLNVHINSSRKHYPDLFKFLDNLGNVVVTNNGAFFKFLDSQAVVDHFVRKDPSLAAYQSKPTTSGGSYCMIAVPALHGFIGSVHHSLRCLVKVLAVGFTRVDDSEAMWDFKDSFVVFEYEGELQVYYGDSIDTRNSALLEVFDSFKSASGKSDFEKVVGFLSI
uniref:23kDa protein n=1 Tax=Grapevine leafroll-associated virus 4 TaxID=70177 RepID=I7HDT4_9CLOS|nr:23kDa protein [Grapevine leafroll-associated virus 4]